MRINGNCNNSHAPRTRLASYTSAKFDDAIVNVMIDNVNNKLAEQQKLIFNC